MKFFNLCLIVFFLFTSCTTSSDAETGIQPLLKNDGLPFFKFYEGSPSNILNPYDIVGQLHSELFTTYYESDSSETSLEAVTDRVALLANQNSGFVSLSGSSYSFTLEARLAYVMQYGSCCSEGIIIKALESETAVISLTGFVNSVISLCNEENDFAAIYSFITLYEDEILASKNISEFDKKIILTTSSIVRFISYERKKRPKKNTDPEWDLMIGSIVGSIEGGSSSIEDAIVMSLICGVVENGW
ncbi:hypothetical protein [uncultured Flavobacterium sp.]|uniref:hypothetical protein n=1 Tax=uncultured Flavobacterium sp. TaxID=165435 RepID=UPI0030EB8BA2|tara:strand:- start:44640 stop:45374 length:735 start_codon:yes stop_codon:yes gene_type:complete